MSAVPNNQIFQNQIIQVKDKQYCRLLLEGKKYWVETTPFSDGGATQAKLYNVFPDLDGKMDEEKPLAVKCYGPQSEERKQSIRQEGKKQNEFFETQVYELPGHRMMMLMPKFPGKPIIEYDPHSDSDVPHEDLKGLSLPERLLLAVVVLQAYKEFYADRVQRYGLTHVDLKPENVLIEINRDQKGRLLFRCSIIDFADTRAWSPFTAAPEIFQSKNNPTVQMAIYSLTSIMAVIFGETEPYALKDQEKVETKKPAVEYFLGNMQAELRRLSKAFFEENNGAKQEILRHEIIANLEGVLPENEFSLIQELNKKSASSADFIRRLIGITVMRMGAQKKEERPQDFLIIAKIFKVIENALRQYEYECPEQVALGSGISSSSAIVPTSANLHAFMPGSAQLICSDFSLEKKPIYVI